MKNLKKVLSLVLATAMVMSLMIVGAGAVNFTDDATIEHDEAVQVVSALNIIAGYPDGTFKGTRAVTRAEMAKMICVALNGGVDPTLGVMDTPTYSDVRNSSDAWAEPYIEYCTNLGIVSGVGGGRFNPSRTVKGTEAAKMLLVALGYDSDIFGFTGAGWSTNVAVKANEAKLYDDLSLSTANKELTRDEAAQMINNMLDAYVMIKTYDKVINNGEISYKYELSDTETFLNKYYEAYTFIGTYVGNSDSLNLSNSGQVRVQGCLDTQDKDSVSNTATFPSDMDISNIGEEIKVIFKDGNSGSDRRPDRYDTIYGVFNTGKTEVINATRHNVKDGSDAPTASDKVKVGDTEYRLAIPTSGHADVVTNYCASSSYSTAAAFKAAIEALKVNQSGDTIKFVTDDNGDITGVYVVETRIAYITSINGTKVSINGVGTIDIADNDIYADAARNDIVTYTKLYDTDKDDAYFIVREAESITGELTGYKVQGGTYRNVTLNGENYSFYTRQPALTAVSIGDNDTVSTLSSDDIGETFTAYMVNGYVGYLMQDSDSANKLAVIKSLNNGKLGSIMNEPKAELVLADGTRVVAILDDNSTIYKADGSKLKDDGKDVNINDAGVLAEGQLVRYNETSDGTYKIVEVTGSESNGYVYTTGTANGSVVYDKDTKSFNNVVTSGDCVLFVKQTDPADGSIEYKAYHIRNLNDVKPASGTSWSYITKDGRVVAAYVELAGRPSGASGDMVYGVVSAFNGTRRVNGDYYQVYTVENDAATYTVMLDETSGKITGTGKIVGFEPSSDDIYNDGDIKIYTGTSYDNVNGLATWVKSFSESDRTLTYWTGITGTDGNYRGTGATTVALDDDCVIVYVNADDGEAGDNVGISEFDRVNGYKNVLLIKDDNNSKVVGIIVESSGECDIFGDSDDDITYLP